MSDIIFEFSDDRSEWLEHHGVKGMKWGVRNSDTLRKYSGPTGNSPRAIVDKIKKNGPHPLASVKNQLIKRAKAAKESNDLATQQVGNRFVNRKQYKAFMKTRQATLRAHDPDLVAKGMHTLTDSELTAKIARLEQEKKVRDLAEAKSRTETNRAISAENYKKAKNDAKASSIGAKLLTSTYNATVNYAGKQIVKHVLKTAGIEAEDDKKKGKDKDTDKDTDKDNEVSSPSTDSSSGSSKNSTKSKSNKTSSVSSSSSSSSSSGSSSSSTKSKSQQAATDAGEKIAVEVLNVETVYDDKNRKALPPGK